MRSYVNKKSRTAWDRTRGLTFRWTLVHDMSHHATAPSLECFKANTNYPALRKNDNFWGNLFAKLVCHYSHPSRQKLGEQRPAWSELFIDTVPALSGHPEADSKSFWCIHERVLKDSAPACRGKKQEDPELTEATNLKYDDAYFSMLTLATTAVISDPILCESTLSPTKSMRRLVSPLHLS